MSELNYNEVKSLYEKGLRWQEIADALGVGKETVRNFVRRSDFYQPKQKGFKREEHITDTVKLEIKDDKLFTEEELLQIHGFDPEEFSIKQARSNEWTMHDRYNYQSKIDVVPKKAEDVVVDSLEEILQEMTPLKPKHVSVSTKGKHLLIPLFDLHFGLEGNKHLDLLTKISAIAEKGCENITVVIGGDYLHYDNFNKTTEKGTFVNGTSLKIAVKRALDFAVGLLDKLSTCTENLKVVFLKGNHAPSNDFVLIETLKYMMGETDIEFVTDNRETKTFLLGRNYIAVHHGDKATPKRLVSALIANDMELLSQATSRYIITGHLHNEKTISDFGFTHYQVSSPSKASQYEKDFSFNSSEDNQMIFEFDDNKRTAIYYL